VYRVKISSQFADRIVEVEAVCVMAAVIEALNILDYRNLDEVTGIVIDPL
jgi:maleate cis-trans isomerase